MPASFTSLDSESEMRRKRIPHRFSRCGKRSKPKQIWEIRLFQNERRRLRNRALFDLAIDSKLQGCDLVRMRLGDIVSGGQIRMRALVMQQKTSRPVQFELLPDARASLLAWLERRGGTVDDYVFPSRIDRKGHISTRP
ncbi:MAG: hypothetical protein V2I43_08275 [Parvularcula sp.]|jgi:integrase|nr:hypothetical protein [Parvularcula sp.]